MRMPSSLYAMALMMTVMGSGNMGFRSSRSNYEPTLPPVKRVLPGKFKGSVPKGCKLETVKISVDWDNVTLVKNVDIVSGSEKSKQKSLIKIEAQIHEWLFYTKLKRQEVLNSFDEVIERSIQNCPFTACSINEKGHCISTNTVQCTSVPDCFNEDKER